MLSAVPSRSRLAPRLPIVTTEHPRLRYIGLSKPGNTKQFTKSKMQNTQWSKDIEETKMIHIAWSYYEN